MGIGLLLPPLFVVCRRWFSNLHYSNIHHHHRGETDDGGDGHTTAADGRVAAAAAACMKDSDGRARDIV